MRVCASCSSRGSLLKTWCVLLRGQRAAAGGPGGHQSGPAADAGVRPRLRLQASSQHQHAERRQQRPEADRECGLLQDARTRTQTLTLTLTLTRTLTRTQTLTLLVRGLVDVDFLQPELELGVLTLKAPPPAALCSVCRTWCRTVSAAASCVNVRDMRASGVFEGRQGQRCLHRFSTLWRPFGCVKAPPHCSICSSL